VCFIAEPITNAELAALSEELYVLEGPNNAYRYIQVSSLAKEGFNSSEGILKYSHILTINIPNILNRIELHFAKPNLN